MPSTPSDAELLDQYARGGDMQAFATIVDRYEADLMRVARAMLIDGDLAQDAVQETLLRLTTGADAVAATARTANSEHRIGPWLYTVLRRHCIDLIRRRQAAPQQRMPERWQPEVIDQPETVMAAREQAERLWSAVDELPPLERSMVVLRYQEGLDYRAIAERLGKTVNHVGVVLHRAMKRLREQSDLHQEAQA